MLSCLALVHAGGLLWSIMCHSPTIDETAHLPAGLSHWEFGDFALYGVNPPLVRMLAAAAVYPLRPERDWSRYQLQISNRSEFAVGRDFIAANGLRSLLYYRVGRSVCMVFSLVGVIACYYSVSRSTALNSGLVAGVLWCMSPAILAHGSLLTSDVAAAAFGLVACLQFRSWCRIPNTANAFLVGIATGLALLSKLTWVVILPLTMLMVGGAVCLFSLNKAVQSWSLKRSGHVLLAVITSILVVDWGYLGKGIFVPIGDIHFVSKAFSRQDPAIPGTWHRVNRLAGSVVHGLPFPLPVAYIQGIDAQKRDFEAKFPSYLMGEWKDGGWWYYYLVGFLVKEPIGFQLMLYASIFQGLWNWRQWTRESILEWSPVVVPPFLIFCLVSSQTGLNHHMRYVLPAYPFLFIIAARTVLLGRYWRLLSYLCLIWQASAVLWFAPHWMSYFNEGAGGPVNGSQWLVDSNIDWGQDVLLLKWWQDDHPEATSLNAVLNTGFDPAHIGLKYTLPPGYLEWKPNPEDGRWPRLEPGWYAVSISQLRGHCFPVPDTTGRIVPSNSQFSEFLNHLKPIDRIGYSINIYHFTSEQAAQSETAGRSTFPVPD